MKPITDTDLEQLSAYIDGELSDSERRFFQKRLSSDVELRAYCERIWIASSVLKSQPFQIMPLNNAESISSKCEHKRNFNFTPMRLVASFGALAIVAGIGFQLMKTTEMPSTVVQISSPTATTLPVQVAQSTTQTSQNDAVVDPNNSQQGVNASSALSVDNAQLVAQNDPSQFELNESTRSKSWPRSNQDMDEFLVRHNQMVDANSSNGLISYAQILTDEDSVIQEQGDQ
jgi:negative regulator of sigma E activity